MSMYFLRAPEAGLLFHRGAETGGWVPPAFVEQARLYQQFNGRPLLREYKDPKGTFYWEQQGLLHLGDPEKDPDVPTWREYLAEDPDEVIPDELLEEYGLERQDLDEGIWGDSCDFYICRTCSSTASAYHTLHGLELGPDSIPEGAEVLGWLDFTDGVCPGNDSLLVEGRGDLAVACLQRRLRQLGHFYNFRSYP